MILNEGLAEEIDWLGDLANLPPDVRSALLLMLDTLANDAEPTFHFDGPAFLPQQSVTKNRG